MSDRTSFILKRTVSVIILLAGMATFYNFQKLLVKNARQTEQLDFPAYYVAHDLAKERQNVYDIDLVRKASRDLGVTFVIFRANLYSPPFYWVLSKIPVSDISNAQSIFVSIKVFLLLISVILLVLYLFKDLEKQKRWNLSMITTGVVLFCLTLMNPVTSEFKDGQVNIITLFVLTLALVTVKSQILSGLFISIGALLKIGPVILIARMAFYRKYRSIFSFLIITALLLLCSYIYFGNQMIEDYFTGILFPFFGASEIPILEWPVSHSLNQSVRGFFHRLFVNDYENPAGGTGVVFYAPWLGSILTWIVNLSLIFSVVWTTIALRSYSKDKWINSLLFSLFIILMSLISPLTWYHHLVTLIIPFVVLTAYTLQSFSRHSVILFSGLGLFVLSMYFEPVYIYLDLNKFARVKGISALYYLKLAGTLLAGFLCWFAMFHRLSILHHIPVKQSMNLIYQTEPLIKWLKLTVQDAHRYTGIIYRKLKTLFQTPVWFLPFLVFLTIFAVNLNYFNKDHYEIGDYAANGIQVLKAAAFTEMVGPYSRFEFNHPGPVSFYFFALSEPLLFFIKNDLGKHFAAQLLLNMALFLQTLRIVWHITGSKKSAAIYAAVHLLTYTSAGSDLFYSIWGPAIMVFPTGLFLAAAVFISTGKLRHILSLTVAAVIICHNHSGGLAYVVPLALISFFLYFKNARNPFRLNRNLKRKFIISVIFFLVVNIPPLIQQFTSGPYGNISLILDYVFTNTSLRRFDKTLAFVLGFFADPFRLPESFPAGLVFFIVLTSYYMLKQKTDPAHKAYFFNLSLSGVALTIYAALKIPGDFVEYLLWYEYAFVGAMIYTVADQLWAQISSRISDLPVNTRPLKVLAPVAVIFTIVLSSINKEKPVEDFPKVAADFIQPQKKITYRLTWNEKNNDLGQWVYASGTALHLIKNGYDVCFDDFWRFMFGEKLMCSRNNRHSPPLFIPGQDDYPVFGQNQTATIRFETVADVPVPGIISDTELHYKQSKITIIR